MDSKSNDSSSQPSAKETSKLDHSSAASISAKEESNVRELASTQSSSSSTTSSWASRLQNSINAIQDSQTANAGISAFARFTRGFGSQKPSMDSPHDKNVESNPGSATQQFAALESLTKGFVDSSRSAVKAMQVKVRHIVSQNKRRYQDGSFDLDMTYITENIITMGFPAGSLTSGFFGYLEGLYRNHMEEVIKFFETHHKGRYKVYNLCSERLYDASLFEGKVASFPFDDHNCPPIQLISSFCQSAMAWLREDIQNVVVVHCKAGMGRTGLMICSLLLYLKFFPTADEVIEYYNQKRCVDGKALVLPSQIRYVKYFERILKEFKGEKPPGRRCMLRGFQLHKCPYWVRPSITISDHNGILFSSRKHLKTKDLRPEDFWIKAARKGIVVFALPGEPGITELNGDFKIHFHDHQGDFYCWLNTTMTGNRTTLDASELDGFDKRKLPSPGFQLEIVMIDYDGNLPTRSKPESDRKKSDGNSSYGPGSGVRVETNKNQSSQSEDNDDVFSDSDGDEKGDAKSKTNQDNSAVEPVRSSGTASTQSAQQTSLGSDRHSQVNSVSQVATSEGRKRSDPKNEALPKLDLVGESDIKAMAADVSVFSFGDDEDFESD